MTTLVVGRGLVPVGGVDPEHRAVLVDGATIAWTGADPADAPAHHDLVDLGEAWLMPGFVDAHVHATATGLQARGVELSRAGSVAEVLEGLRTLAGSSDDVVLYGAGWDDTDWPEQRPPTAAELSAAAPGRTVLLVRVDGHSCVVDARLLAELDLAGMEAYVDTDAEGRPTGWLLEAASERAQAVMRERLHPAQLVRARTATVQRALDLGVTAIHEMGIPALSDRADAEAWAHGDWPIDVAVYWAALELDPDPLVRPGGDLFLDGSIGSCTAATVRPYRTASGRSTTGVRFHDDEAVTAFFMGATRARRGAGVHAIGDAAIDQATRALTAVAEHLGMEEVRSARHRIEHLELATPSHLRVLADLGVTASMQPAFDAAWNGPGGLYERRFGRRWADASNPVGLVADSGVRLCFSSDSTVTPMDPWAGVLAAERHHGGHTLPRRAALHAATIAGHEAIGQEHLVGALRPGRRADLVAWPFDPLTEPEPGGHPLAVWTGGHPRRLDAPR